jgi:hypothetical protein
LDDRGEVILEQRLSTTTKVFEETVGRMPQSRVALETRAHSPWVSRLLTKLGHEVIVAHARNVRWIGESRYARREEKRQEASGRCGSAKAGERESLKKECGWKEGDRGGPAKNHLTLTGLLMRCYQDFSLLVVARRQSQAYDLERWSGRSGPGGAFDGEDYQRIAAGF